MNGGPPKARPLHPLAKLAIDLGPLVLFFVVNAKAGIFWGTGVFMVAFLMSLVVGYLVERKLEPMPLFTGLVVLVFGGLTLYLRDETFIKLKPTIIYATFSLLLFAGLASGRPLIRFLFERAFHLTDEGWRKLTLRWAFFFAALALLNEAVRHMLSTDAWVAFKVWGFLPLTLAFTLAQTGLIRRHALPSDTKL